MVHSFKRKLHAIVVTKQKYFGWLFGLSILLIYAYAIYTTGLDDFGE